MCIKLAQASHWVSEEKHCQRVAGELHQPPGGCSAALGEIGSATLNLQAE